MDGLDNILSYVTAKYDKIIVVGDVNLNSFNFKNWISECFDTYAFGQLVKQASRITSHSATLIDPIFVNCS